MGRFPQESKSRRRNEFLVPWKYWCDLTDFTGERLPPWQWLPLQKAISGKYIIAIAPLPQDVLGLSHLLLFHAAPPALVVIWVRVQEEAHESGIIEVVSIDPIFVPVAVHLKPDLIPGAEVQQHGAAGLVDVVALELIVGEDHSLVLPVEADLDV